MITAGESAIEGGAGFEVSGFGGSCWAAEALQTKVAKNIRAATIQFRCIGSSIGDGGHLDGVAYGSGRRRERDREAKSIGCRTGIGPAGGDRGGGGGKSHGVPFPNVLGIRPLQLRSKCVARAKQVQDIQRSF